MAEKYVNKFHNFKFETDAKRDLEEHAPKLNKPLTEEMISDDSSNETLLKYRYAAEEDKNLENKE